MRISRIFLFALVLLVSGSGLSFAGEVATIVTQGGDTYADVEFTVDKQYKVVTFEWEGSKKNVSFSRIESITSPGGQDIIHN